MGRLAFWITLGAHEPESSFSRQWPTGDWTLSMICSRCNESIIFLGKEDQSTHPKVLEQVDKWKAGPCKVLWERDMANVDPLLVAMRN